MEGAEGHIKKHYTYLDLAKAVDFLIAKYGMQRAVEKIHILSDRNEKLKPAAAKNNDVLINYIIALALTTFNLEGDQFYVSNEIDYRDARMVCFHLIKINTGYSFTKLSKKLKQSRRTVQYQFVRCRKLLETPINTREQMIQKHYRNMEKEITCFLSETQ